MGAITAVRILYVVLAILLAVPTTLGVIGTLAAFASGFPGASFLVVFNGLLVAVTALFVMGALRVHAQPMIWSVLIAGFMTVGAVLAIMGGLSLANITIIAIAAGCWVAVAMVASAAKTIYRFSDEGLRRAERMEQRRQRTSSRRAHLHRA